MLMPFQPYRDLGPAEEMASQRRPGRWPSMPTVEATS